MRTTNALTREDTARATEIQVCPDPGDSPQDEAGDMAALVGAVPNGSAGPPILNGAHDGGAPAGDAITQGTINTAEPEPPDLFGAGDGPFSPADYVAEDL